MEEWSFLWENPEDYLIVRYSHLFPDEPDLGMIFEKSTRYYLGIENDTLLRALVRRMREAGVETVESRDFNPEPTEARKIIDEGHAAGLPREEINRRLKELGKRIDPFMPRLPR